MKVKRMVKRLFAVGTGAAMLGATAMGAMAADLSGWGTGDLFVKDGVLDALIVVGATAKAEDTLAAVDIASNVPYSVSSTGSSVTVSGDNWMVGTSSKKLELANNNATASSVGSETFRDINNFIGEDELGALADDTWATNENDYEFQQFLFFDSTADPSVSRIVKYTENDDDETADHLFIKSGRQIARYKLEFTSTAQSDVTDSTGTASTTGTDLDDFKNTELSMMGQGYSVVLAERPSSGSTARQHGAKLTLMGGATRDTLLEGESKTYTIDGNTYDVTVTFTDADEAKFIVNGESTNKLQAGETHILSDKSEIGVSEVLYQAYAGGVHSATFFVGASKMILEDRDVSTAPSGEQKLKVGSEDIDGTLVTITGSDDNTTFTISTIEVNMTADDDYFVAADEKLSDVVAASGEEEEVLMNGAFDIEYHGLSGEETHELRLASSSSRRYKLQLYDGDGNMVSLPTAYAESATGLNVSEDTGQTASATNRKRLVLDETVPLQKNDYFVVTGGTAGDGSAKSYLLQYRGVDKSTDTSPKISFKNMGSGETLEYSASDVTAALGSIATIKLGGYSFGVESAGGDQTADDYVVLVDMNTNGISDTNATYGTYVDFIDSFGSQWSFNATCVTNACNGDVSQGTDPQTPYLTNVTGIQWAMSTPNTDDYDNQAPTNLVLNISAAAGPEVRAAILTTGTWAGTAAGPVTLVTPDGETEVSYGYTSMGTHIKFAEPSGDPDELTLTYPKNQMLPQVFLTSGSTTTASKSGKTANAKVVDATKLDTEVSSLWAQNSIVVGGPCVNSLAAELMGNPANCAEGFSAGKAKVKVFESNGKVAMLVAGFSGADTRCAGKVLAHRGHEVTGEERDISCTSLNYNSATISAPVKEVMVDKTTE